jgi:asparagine synthetase B (glutamine-hydrolysing)
MKCKPNLVGQHRYRFTSGGPWKADISDLMTRADALTVDTASLHSIIGCGYTFGNRTLFKEIKRLPWMSRAESDGRSTRLEIPPHQFIEASPEKIADRLFNALLEETRSLVQGRSEVVLLLSGGLDSRIAALVVSELIRR